MATDAGPEEYSGAHRLTSAEFDALYLQLRTRQAAVRKTDAAP